MLKELFFPPDTSAGYTQVDRNIEQCKVVAQGFGATFGTIALIYAIVGNVLGTVSSVGVLAALFTSASMFTACATGGIGWVMLPIIVGLGSSLAVDGAVGGGPLPM